MHDQEQLREGGRQDAAFAGSARPRSGCSRERRHYASSREACASTKRRCGRSTTDSLGARRGRPRRVSTRTPSSRGPAAADPRRVDALPKGSRERHLGLFRKPAVHTHVVKPQISLPLSRSQLRGRRRPPAGRRRRSGTTTGPDPRAGNVVARSSTARRRSARSRSACASTSYSPARSSARAASRNACNQNNQQRLGYNGRPSAENYRDRFPRRSPRRCRRTPNYVSVTFNAEAMHQADRSPGWRASPYAPAAERRAARQIDRIPGSRRLRLPRHLGLRGPAGRRFGGRAIDASAKPKPIHGFRNLGLTQLLDERKADDGRSRRDQAKADRLVPISRTFYSSTCRASSSRSTTRTRPHHFNEDQDGICERICCRSLPAGGRRPPSHFSSASQDRRPASNGLPALRRCRPRRPCCRGSRSPATAYHERRRGSGVARLPRSSPTSAGSSWCGRARATARPVANVAADAGRVTPFTVLAPAAPVAARAQVRRRDAGAARTDIARIEACHFARRSDAAVDPTNDREEWLARAS